MADQIIKWWPEISDAPTHKLNLALYTMNLCKIYSLGPWGLKSARAIKKYKSRLENKKISNKFLNWLKSSSKKKYGNDNFSNTALQIVI